MNLIFIYGPPAAGKLTVAKELQKLTNYKLFNNHTFVGCIADVFPWDDNKLGETRRELSRRLRIEVFTEAAKAGVDLISTFGMSGKNYFDFFREINKSVEDHSGKVIFVQLLASKNVLMERVIEESRKGNKIDTKEFLDDFLIKHPEILDKFPDVEHLTVDSSNLSPGESASKILDYYKLSI